MTYTLTLTPTGTVDREVTRHPNFVEARRALVAHADHRGLRINTSSEGPAMSGSLTCTVFGGTVHQATHVWTIREEN